jgi:hypothetical protein
MASKSMFCKRKDQAQKEQGFPWVFEALEAVLFDAQAKQAGTHASHDTSGQPVLARGGGWQIGRRRA